MMFGVYIMLLIKMTVIMVAMMWMLTVRLFYSI
jgi:hypothetical protein